MMSVTPEITLRKEMKRMFERLKRDLGIRAALSLILIVSAVVFVGISMFTGKTVPESFMVLVAAVVTYYFSNRSTMDKPQ